MTKPTTPTTGAEATVRAAQAFTRRTLLTRSALLGSAAAAPLIAILYERTGNLTTVLLVLAGFAVITMACALFFPDRREELAPELWEQANAQANLAPAAAE